MKVTIDACIPPVPYGPVDVYVLVVTPGNNLFSLSRKHGVAYGMYPYVEGVRTPDRTICASLYTHTVCPHAMKGIYTAAIVVMPAGEKVSRAHMFGFSTDQLLVTR
jgi:hypothetical protein